MALYGTDRLIEEKKKDKVELGRGAMTDENIRLIEEVWRQIDFLGKLRDMAALYGCDISRPRKVPARPCSGPTSATLGPSRSRTARP